MMKKNGGGEPSAELAKAIDKKFGSFSALKINSRRLLLANLGAGGLGSSWTARVND